PDQLPRASPRRVRERDLLGLLRLRAPASQLPSLLRRDRRAVAGGDAPSPRERTHHGDRRTAAAPRPPQARHAGGTGAKRTDPRRVAGPLAPLPAPAGRGL